ncbi:hypothetical protein EOC94_23675 [Mesorhizobium sp. M6A.T.Ce.TU.016.01.1.1]|nr:hypothetical protein EOC94_23675 [Mesorhizobium sp. M6A.T.Ce.TU.016.01.1.1]
MISPLVGEMSPKATEGVPARGMPTPFATTDDVRALCEPTPSGLPAISPSRGEISSLGDFANYQSTEKGRAAFASPRCITRAKMSAGLLLSRRLFAG